MYLTKKHLSRRTLLKGLGVTMALPFLDAMTPAGPTGTASAAAAATAGRTGTTRLVAMEMVHGSAGSAPYGRQQHMWSPAAAGRHFDLSPTSLVSLEPYRDYLTIISNTKDHSAEAWSAPEIGGDHFRSSATYLTQAHPRQTEGSDIDAGTSLDQVYAKQFGQDTAIPSLQLCIEPVDQAGGCDYGYACVYTDTLSWASPTEPLPAIRNPRAVFNQLFGLGNNPQDREARRRAKASILDWLTVQIAEMKKTLGASDRRRFDNYLTDVREIERRIQNVEKHNASGAARELPEAPVGVPDSFHEHVQLMMDLIAAAFQADLTRVVSFKLGRDASARVYPGAGCKAATAAFHPTSHHQEKPENLEIFKEINSYHVSMVPYLLAKLKSVQEPEGTLLDNSVIIYGSPMGDSNVHNHSKLPLFLMGHAGGRIRGNVHIETPEGTPMANAWLAVLQAMGVNREKFGDSTEAMDLNPTVETTVAERQG
ncbi:MAG: DUF1552 domain-containing protein [Acidobacteriota bacterium]|nr:DUF1552 domain-containing protein [Acidobacteriota bacterium]